MFYERLIQLCRENGLDITDFVKSLGMSSGNTGHWKNGKMPGRKTMDAIAEKFNVSIDYLTGKTDIKNRPSKMDGLSKEEFEMLNLYRKASEDKKRLAKLALESHGQ